MEKALTHGGNLQPNSTHTHTHIHTHPHTNMLIELIYPGASCQVITAHTGDTTPQV